jgi:hypothetical protein
MRTYRRVLNENNSTATSLIDMSIKLDYKTEFPKREIEDLSEQLTARSNVFALSLLRHLVIYHFYLFHVEFMTRQSICAALGISYEGVKVTNPQLKRLSE